MICPRLFSTSLLSILSNLYTNFFSSFNNLHNYADKMIATTYPELGEKTESLEVAEKFAE
jgi:hypothetical protein